jgi:hypothetical protein
MRSSTGRGLTRAFGIEIEQCALRRRLNAIANIEKPQIIERILAHRRERGGAASGSVNELKPTATEGARLRFAVAISRRLRHAFPAR